MEVRHTAGTEKKLKDLSAVSGRGTDELIEDAMAGYLAEVLQTARRSTSVMTTLRPAR
jgi:hypothetical protein